MKELIYIEIQGLYDGIAVEFNPASNEFTWRDVATQRTTEEYRKQFEQSIIKQYKEQQDENK